MARATTTPCSELCDDKDLLPLDETEFQELLETDAANFVSILGRRKIIEEHHMRRGGKLSQQLEEKE